MSTSILTEVVYNDTDDSNPVTFYEDGVAIDLSNTTRVVVKLEGLSDIDTDVTSTAVDFTTDSADGTLIFNFNDLGIDPGKYLSTTIVYDASHADGQVLTHRKGANLYFCFVDA